MMSTVYTIAVSYASEQRYYVEKFVNYFIEKNINIYYDRNEPFCTRNFTKNTMNFEQIYPFNFGMFFDL